MHKICVVQSVLQLLSMNQMPYHASVVSHTWHVNTRMFYYDLCYRAVYEHILSIVTFNLLLFCRLQIFVHAYWCIKTLHMIS